MQIYFCWIKVYFDLKKKDVVTLYFIENEL